MGHKHIEVSRKTRLRAVIGISFAFFLAEISVGFYTKSLALVADAFHYLNDLIGFIVALVAVHMTERKTSPADMSFGWARAQLLGAFFNGAFLLALGLSIGLQSIERFIDLKHVENPKLVLIVGSVGLGLNIISALFLHEHDHGDGGHSHGHSHSHSHAHGHEQEAHSHPEDGHAEGSTATSSSPRHATHNHLTISTKPKGMDLGMMGVLVHVMGDALNNVGVIIAALIIWLTKSSARFYADPAVSLWIALMILASAVPLTKRSGAILLQSAPPGVNIDHVKKDLESIPGVKGVHELHVWRLDQKKAIASAHVVVSEENLAKFMEKAQVFSECLHAYGIHSATLQPELVAADNTGSKGEEDGTATATGSGASSVTGSLRSRAAKCGLTCGTLCEPLMCCN